MRDVKRRSIVSKEMPSRESDRIVDVSSNNGGRWGKYSYVVPVTSIVTSVMTGEGTISLENTSDNPSRPDVLKRNIFMRLRWTGS